MKNLNILSLICCVTILIHVSCGKDELGAKNELIRGEWIWIRSYGGEAGETLTPENTMSIRVLEIDNSIYREYVNDSLILETTYTLSITNEPLHNESNTLMKLGDGDIVSVIIEESELEIIEGCFDCYSHKYERK